MNQTNPDNEVPSQFPADEPASPNPGAFATWASDQPITGEQPAPAEPGQPPTPVNAVPSTPQTPSVSATWSQPAQSYSPPPSPAPPPTAWPQSGQPYSPPPRYTPPSGAIPPYGYGGPYQGRPGYAPGIATANGGYVLAVGIVSIFLLQFILGPVALVMGQRAIRLIEVGRANRAETNIVNAGRICGLLGTVIGVILVCIFVASMIAGAIKGRETLAQARAHFSTTLIKQVRNTDPLPNPPAGFSIVRYHAPLGDFPAILVDPETLGTTSVKIKHPAIIWITGGFSNEIGDDAWAPTTPDNDQSGSAFYKAGMVEMYPSLRGGNGNAGYVETCYGEVDDILAAEKFLAAQPNVDPNRIYLGGHSTGGTNALLVDASSTGQFRAVFSFGAVADTADYGQDNDTYNIDDADECRMRAPNQWLPSIKTPTYIIEGDGGNIDSLHELQNDSSNDKLHFIEVTGSDHFGELSRTTPVVAKKIMADTSPTCNITINAGEWLPAPPTQ